MAQTAFQRKGYIRQSNLWVVGQAATIGSKQARQINLAAENDPLVTTGNLTGSGTAVTATVGTAGVVVVALTGGTFTGLPLSFEATNDGSNWFPVCGSRADGSTIDIAPTVPSQASLPLVWTFAVPGYSSFRVRQSAAATTQTVNPVVRIQQKSFLIAPALSVGRNDGSKFTYAAGLSDMALSNGNGIIATVKGKTGAIVRVTRFSLQVATGGSTATGDALLSKYSTAHTGGTTQIASAVAVDSADPAASSNLLTGYTVFPTAGTLVGSLRAKRFLIGKTAGAVSVDSTIEFINSPTQTVVLRSASESIALVLNTTATANVASIDVEWTEE